MKHKLLSILLCLAMALSLLPTAALAEEAGATEDYVTLELTYGSNVTAEQVAAAKVMYEGKKYETCKAANEAYMALYGVGKNGDGVLDVVNNNAPLHSYVNNTAPVTEVKFYIHGTLAGFTSLLSAGNQIDCTVGGNHQIARTSISIIGVDGSDGSKAKLTDGNVQAYVAGGYDNMYTDSGKLTIDNIEFTTTKSTTVAASAANATGGSTKTATGEMEIKNCVFRGRLYVYDNFENKGAMTYNIHDNVFDGANYSGDSNAYSIFAQCRGGNELIIKDNRISGFARGINIDHANVNATIEGNTISVTDTGRSCIQLSRLATTTISGNTLNLTGGNAITLHENLLTMSTAPEVSITGNTITGNGYLIYDDAMANGKSFTSENLRLTYSANTVDDTVNTTEGVKGSNKYGVSAAVEAATISVAEVAGKTYPTLQEAINAGGRKTVTLLANTRENVTINKAMTLDLNGHTLNGGTEKGKPALTITARVTVMDSSAAQTGTIKREDTAVNSGVSSHYVIDIQGGGWLTFESGNVENNSGNTEGKGASLVRVGDDSVAKYPGLNIKGGTFTQDNFIVIKVDSGDLFLNGGTLNSTDSYAIEDWHRATIKGGTVNGTVAAWTYSGGHNSTLDISGGTVNGDVISVNYGSTEGKVAKVSITGGTVNGTLGTYTYSNGLTATEDPSKATIGITGGTFKNDPSKYVVEGSTATQNDDGTFGVAKAYLARIGETFYYTMEDAFEAQTDGDTIVLLRDYTTGSPFNSGSIKRTVDLNGHTWTCTGTDANSAAFEINYANASLTVKNGKIVSTQLVGLIPSAMGGTIKYDNSSLTFENVEMSTTATSGIETNGNNTNDSVTLKNSTLNVPTGFGIYFPSSGTLTIDNSTINAKTMGVQVCAGSLNINAGSTITVSGDPVKKTENDGAIQDGAAISIVNRTGYKGLGNIAVTGGTFTAKDTNAAIKAYNWENKTESDFNASDKVSVSVSGGTFTSEVPQNCCAPGFVPKANSDGTYGVEINKNEDMVAEVLDAQGNTVGAYGTLAAAITEAKNGETVKLLKDTKLEDAEYYINKSVTINGSGKISCTVKTGKTTRAFVVEENGSLTLDGVVLDIQGTKNPDTAEKNDGTGIDVQFGGKLVLKNQAVLKLHDLERGTISSKPDGSPEIPGQFVIDNSTFNSTNIDGNISNGGDWTVTNGSTVNINNCGSYGLSVDSLTTEQSTVNISGTGYSAIYGKDLQFKDGSNVLINGAGTELPLQSKWSDARSPIQTHKDGGTIVVESGATVTVRDCKDKDGKANNTIYLPKNTTYTNNGTVNATIITADAPEDSCVVTLVSDGKTIGVQTVPKDSVFTLPAAPKKNNYTFNGWYDGSKFYAAGASYTVSATVTLNASWSYISSGSSSYDPTYSVSTPSKTENGSVTVSPKNASKGDTVTVTVKPDSGYVLETLTVTDKNGNELTLKDKGNGKYTFTMPAGKVEVKATFMEDNSMLNFFYDVPNNAYFYEAVKWAVKNGITTGVGNDLFAPEQPCTRAQIVTFLWRAAGSPEPKGTSSFADVAAGSYYAKAVAWAVENGITTGTGDGKFSPDATCTRAQAVTFLARALSAKASGKAEFSDVPADSYFADAVAWAAANGVTEGIGGGLFGPDNDCTRGQIVTFLYRAYNK